MLIRHHARARHLDITPVEVFANVSANVVTNEKLAARMVDLEIGNI